MSTTTTTSNQDPPSSRDGLVLLEPQQQRSTTNITIQLPRFYPNEVEDGIYPSKLHYIHIQSFLSTDEAATCLTLSQDYAQRTGSWDQPDFERHSTYATCDFAVEQCQELCVYLEEIGFHTRVWQRLEELYEVEQEDLTYLDFFCANYRAAEPSSSSSMTALEEEATTRVTTKRTLDRLEAHRDGSILSFSLLLTPPTQFEGGGTFYDALRDVEPVEASSTSSMLHSGGVIRPLHAGDIVFHSGKVLHGADVVTAGQRTVLVGFADVANWCQRPHVLATACRNFGRMDVATFRYKQQVERLDKESSSSSSSRGWVLNNARWLSDTRGDRGRSHVRGFAPVFRSTAHRADPEFQRLRKLEAEDFLLRTILLPEKAMGEEFFFDDSISIL
jgi:hypothetical protein